MPHVIPQKAVTQTMSSVALQDKEWIYLEYKDKVTAYVRGKIGNEHDTEDIVSSVFLKVFQKIDDFDETKALLSTWIYTITRNTVIDHYKTRKIHIEFSDEIETEEIAEDPLVMEDEIVIGI